MSAELNSKTKEELIKELKVLSAIKVNLEDEKEKSAKLQKQRDKIEKDLRLILFLKIDFLEKDNCIAL